MVGLNSEYEDRGDSGLGLREHVWRSGKERPQLALCCEAD